MSVYEYKAVMVNVVDGDTQDFVLDLGFSIKHKIRVRLLDIDTPETYRPKSLKEKEHGQLAKAYVKENFLNKEGILKTSQDKGKYGRYLADFVIVEDDNVSTSLVLSLKANGFEKRDNYNVNN